MLTPLLLTLLMANPPRGLDLYRPAPEDNPITKEQVKLGRKLFFDKRLSRDGTVACATCHNPAKAFTDGQLVAVGIEGKKGRGRSGREDTMVNDDLNAFDDLGSQLARQSAEYENQSLAQLLVSNPVMSDGNPLFSTAHKNIAATPGAIAEATLSAARYAMRLQSNANNQPIDVRPSYLLTTAANETTAQQALAAIYPTQVNYVNVFTDALKLIIDPRLDVAGPSTAWYLFSDSTVPVLEDSYLSGYEGPRVTTRLSPQMGGDLDGVYVYLLLDYGCGAIGWQGGYYNAGA